MALYVDCAYLHHIIEAAQAVPLAGVTMNPSIMLAAREQGQKLDPLSLLQTLLEQVEGTIFIQPGALTEQEMLREALTYIQIAPQRVIPKIPMTQVGLKVAIQLKHQQHRVAFTAVTSLAQTYCALQAGADYLIPYFNRLERSGINASQRVTQMVQLIAQHQATVPTAAVQETRLLVASLKTPAEVAAALLAGAHDLTITPNVLLDMVRDPLSEQAVDKFAQDWQKMNKL